MSEKQRRWGQYYTASEVVDLVLGFCLRRPTDRLLDPCCGEGAFLLRAAHYQRWLSNVGVVAGRETLWGIEIDSEAAAAAQASLMGEASRAHLLVDDFFSLLPGQVSLDVGGVARELPQAFDCIVGNPPYTRSEWLTQVTDESDYRDRLVDQVSEGLGARTTLNKRAGLHAYFFLHGSKFLRPGGRFGFVASNSWLDVDYGRGLKQFLLDRYRILAIIESAVEQWFPDARVNTCLVILERCDDGADRARNKVRMVRLEQPLVDLISTAEDSPGRAVEVENLVMRLLPGTSRRSGDMTIRVVTQATLEPQEKWGPLMRAPDVFFAGQTAPASRALGELANICRGQTTGANAFFYPDRLRRANWQIEDRFLRPLLKTPKEVESLYIRPADLDERVLMVQSGRDALEGTKVGAYIQWGEAQGVHRRSTCARRSPWYALPERPTEEARLAWPKGIWNRHFVLLIEGDIVADQQFYILTVAPEHLIVLAALLNSSWVALQTELVGRSNLGEGVLWLAGYEVAQIRIPDPQCIAPPLVQPLKDAFAQLAADPLLPFQERVTRPTQQALDELVFDLLGFNSSERQTIVEAGIRLIEGRAKRARSG